jgi:hypothetical protein
MLSPHFVYAKLVKGWPNFDVVVGLQRPSCVSARCPRPVVPYFAFARSASSPFGGMESGNHNRALVASPVSPSPSRRDGGVAAS